MLARKDNNLVVLRDQATIKTLRTPNTPAKVIASIEPQEPGLGQDLVITVGGKRIRRSMAGVQDYTVSPDGLSVCYIESKPAKDVPNEYERAIWTWTAAKGFERLSDNYAHLENLTYSQDGKSITASIRGRNESSPTKFLVCSLDGSGSITYAFPFEPSTYSIGEVSPILLNNDWGILLNDKYPRTLCRWNIKNDQTIDINLGGGIVQAINYNGEIWGVRETGRDEYDIVRLSSDMAKVEEIVNP